MDKTLTSDNSRQAVAWGTLFVWWGVTELVPDLPAGVGALGIAVILLGLNVLRRLQHAPLSGFSTTLGILALVLGGLQLANASMLLPFELPVFATLLIVLGVIIVGREVVESLGRQPA